MGQQQQVQQHPDSSLPDKVILVIIDGIGDVTIPAFGDRTPLQVAHTSNLDCIAGVLYCFAAMCLATGTAQQLP
jgi:2,3-bisphosphoglycerate-independent phosphoglycerate mutase